MNIQSSTQLIVSFGHIVKLLRVSVGVFVRRVKMHSSQKTQFVVALMLHTAYKSIVDGRKMFIEGKSTFTRYPYDICFMDIPALWYLMFTH